MMKLKEIIKTDNIIKVQLDNALSSTLSQLASSHDAAFVFDKNDSFIGIVNPYFCLIKTSLPGNAKLQHCLFHPPKIHLNDPISKVAAHMSDSRLHYLPVFDDKQKFTGIISARRLLASFADSSLFNVKIADVLKQKGKPVISIYEDDTVAHAVNTLKERKVSKLVVIGKDLKLKGVLSHYDLIAYLIAPKQKERGGRQGNNVHFNSLKVKNFSKTLVLTLTPKDSLHDALKLILEKKIGSVIIVDEERHPLGIITTRDILNFLKRSKKAPQVEVTTKHLSDQSKQILGGFFERLTLNLRKFPELAKAKLFVKEEKKGGLFKVVLSLIPHKGETKIIEEEGKNLQKVLQKVKNKEG